MWRSAMILVVVAATLAACNFDPDDQNDFIDNPDDSEEPAITSDSLRVSDIASLGVQTKDVQGEVEKLLGQPVFHYEDPATAPPVTTPPSTSPQSQQSEAQQTEKVKEKRKTLKEEKELDQRVPQEKKSVLKGFKDRASQQRESQQRGPRKSQQLPREVEENISERSQTVQSMVSEWSHEAPTISHKSAPGFILKLTSTKFRRRPKLKTKSPRHSIKEVVYSIQVPWEAENPKIGRIPGVIESIVAGHDIVHHEIPNLGGTRPRPANIAAMTTVDDSARRGYLLTIPKALVSSPRTFRPRPMPTTETIYFPYKFTRITRRQPNCTDSYYDCLLKCFDKRGYRVKCWWETPKPRAEPARLNFTGLFLAINRGLEDYDTVKLIKDFREIILKKGYRDCRFSTKPTTTTTEVKPIYYDDMLTNMTGTVMAKCWVCGLRDTGVPTNSYCADNFGNLGNPLALIERSTYRKYCRYMDEVPLWFNRSDPFSVYGTWTGGCSKRWIDLSGLYTQRTCRSTIHPATGMHFLSKRMEMLELALRDEREGCVVSPMATLVPFSRAISLFARIHVCVCAGTFCNRARRAQTGHIGAVILMILLCLRL